MNIKLIIYHLSFIIRKSKGFTLIELMVVLTITAVLGTLGIAGFASYNKTLILNISANEVATMLNLAKSRAQSQVKMGQTCTTSLETTTSSNTLEGYSVTILNNKKYSLESYCFETKNTLDENTLPQNVSFNTTNGSPTSFFFPAQTGGAKEIDSLGNEVSGSSWQIEIIGSDGRIKTITVNALGGVSVQ